MLNALVINTGPKALKHSLIPRKENSQLENKLFQRFQFAKLIKVVTGKTPGEHVLHSCTSSYQYLNPGVSN